MEVNKRCISSFAKKKPFVALATKSKLFDPTFSLTSELILIDYMQGKTYPALVTELKFCKLIWCEFGNNSYLVAGHENGFISVYNLDDNGLTLLKSKQCVEDDITAFDFLPSKAVLVAGSSKGKIIFWTLSNLEKEYALDIPVSGSITSIAWNQKVSKILCVGTVDGAIKVLDIKKNSVIMTLNNKEFTEARHIEWDTENNTKLNVMSEKGYITVFDLSNDMITRFGSHPEPIIGFYQNIIVSKNQIEVGGTFMETEDCFECAVSKRDPVVALSYCRGSTGIVSIPVIKKKLPFCGISRYIITPSSKFEIKVVNTAEAPEEDPFYRSFIQLVHESTDSNEIAEFLLKNTEGIPKENLNLSLGIEIDLKDTFSLELIKGNLGDLKNSNVNVKLGLLDSIISKSTAGFSEIKDFRVLYVFCRLLGDYRHLAELSNPRILAAILIYNNITDFDILANSKEGEILKAVLTKNYGQYLDCKIPHGLSYMKKMKTLESVISDIDQYITAPVQSKKLSEYFWYQLFVNDLKSVENLQVNDANVRYYQKMHTSQGLDGRLKAINLKNETKQASTPFTPTQAHAPIQQSYPGRPLNNAVLTPAPYPTRNPISQPNQIFPGIKSSPSVATQPLPISSSQVQFAQPKIKAPSSYTQPSFKAATQPSYQPTPQPSFGNASQPSFVSQPKSPYSGPIPQAGFPQKPSSSIPIPQAGFPQKPSSSIPIPQPRISYPSPPAQKIPVSPYQQATPQRPIAPSTASNAQQQVQDGTSDASSQTLMENSENIITSFNMLITQVKQKAASNTSLILRQRKQQYLNAIAGYESINRGSISAPFLHAMDLVSKRFFLGGENLKNDLGIIADNFSDIVWLKATVELIKMVY
ncbi:Methylosome protein 50 [Glugoides intestinalis]